VLQELRNEGLVEFLGNGKYFLQDTAIDIDEEDLTDQAVDHAIRSRRLILRDVETGTPTVLARRRRGQDRLRKLSLEQYSTICAVCDITDDSLLVASHILPWADAPDHRGRLDNVICLCRFHDVLFERGHWSLADNLSIVKRARTGGRPIHLLLDNMDVFRSPAAFRPALEFIREHRRRFGFG
jgi:predicted restriction endonuclease